MPSIIIVLCLAYITKDHAKEGFRIRSLLLTPELDMSHPQRLDSWQHPLSNRRNCRLKIHRLPRSLVFLFTTPPNNKDVQQGVTRRTIRMLQVRRSVNPSQGERFRWICVAALPLWVYFQQ